MKKHIKQFIRGLWLFPIVVGLFATVTVILSHIYDAAPFPILLILLAGYGVLAIFEDIYEAGE
jgi:hypothetical protein